MKKTFIAAIAIIGFLMVSCNSKESKEIDAQIDAYEQACKSGDYEKAMEIALDLNEKAQAGKVSMKQANKLNKAANECAKSVQIPATE